MMDELSNSVFRIPNSSVSILGSTGSIGEQALEVAEHLGFRVCALSANTNIRLLEEQTRRFRPTVAAVFDEAAARDFAVRVRDLGVRVASGINGLIEVATVDGADIVVTAVVGIVGLRPTLAAIQLGRRIALANKETLVCAGELVMGKAQEHGAEIIPVDSEHSAIFQCLRGEAASSIKALMLTASGGPFLGKQQGELLCVTPEEALKHPNWNMGRKITIDSATLMNKGLEVIEAVHLFRVPLEKVRVVVHPQSVIHSMVEFVDNSVAAQLADADMRLPIQYAFTCPERIPSPTRGLDIMELRSLTFEAPDLDTFPCLGLALEAAKSCGTAPAVLNGANEAAVEMFLQGGLSFYGISDSVRGALDGIGCIPNPSLDDIIAADKSAKRFVYERTNVRRGT